MRKEIPDDYIAMAEKICPICGCKHQHNAEILIHRYFRSIDSDKRITGYGMCKEDEQKFNDGYLALVECDPDKSNMTDDSIKVGNAYRTGNICHIKRHVADQIFNIELKEDLPMVFVEPGVIQQLEEMTNADNNSN